MASWRRNTPEIMHSLSSSFVLGYHGCSREIGEAILRGDEQLRFSVNEYDWLGSGIYFWETNPIRGLQWAKEAVKRKKFDEAFVIGAVIDLGYCFDLMSHNGMQGLKATTTASAKPTQRARSFMTPISLRTRAVATCCNGISTARS